MGVHGDSIPVLSKQADDLLKAQITPSWTVEIYFLKVYVICSTLSFLFIFYYDSLSDSDRCQIDKPGTDWIIQLT